MQLGFAKAHHQILLEEKWVWPGLGKLAEIWGFHLIFTQWLKLATSNLVHSLGSPRHIIKSHAEEKVDLVLYYRSSPEFWGFHLIFVQRLKLATSNLAHSWGLSRTTIKTTTREKCEHGLGLWKLPCIWGSPLIFLQRPRCPLSVNGAFCTIGPTLSNLYPNLTIRHFR